MLVKMVISTLCVVIFNQASYAIKQRCPEKSAIHCIYIERDSEPKWIQVTMKPINVTMKLCLRRDNVLYLERDDIEHDGTKPNTILVWEFQQCEDESCLKTKYLGADQFILKYKNDQYYSEPSSYVLNVDSDYGEKCF